MAIHLLFRHKECAAKCEASVSMSQYVSVYHIYASVQKDGFVH